MISILVSILVMCILLGLVWWVLSAIPLPAPFGQIARVVCVAIFCIWLIYLLLPFSGFGHTLLR